MSQNPVETLMASMNIQRLTVSELEALMDRLAQIKNREETLIRSREEFLAEARARAAELGLNITVAEAPKPAPVPARAKVTRKFVRRQSRSRFEWLGIVKAALKLEKETALNRTEIAKRLGVPQSSLSAMMVNLGHRKAEVQYTGPNGEQWSGKGIPPVWYREQLRRAA